MHQSIHSDMKGHKEFEVIEMDLFLEAVFRRYGYDFRNYDCDFIQRKLLKRLQMEQVQTIPRLQEKVFRNRDCMNRVVSDFTANGSFGFGAPPGLYALFREKVVPQLKTYPSIRIWQAGCSSGAAYALAIIMEEEGLADRYKIYVTDISECLLEKAKQGVFPVRDLRKYMRHYLKAGGKKLFTDYCILQEATPFQVQVAEHSTKLSPKGARPLGKSRNALFKPSLKKNIVFYQHNFCSDRSFNEFHTIFSENVTEHFNKPLQDRVFKLFHESTGLFGFLSLGKNESLASSPYESCYEPWDDRVKLYRRIR